MYLISIYFDKKTEQAMQSYINSVAKVTGNSFMIDGNIPPHITLLAFNAKNETEVIESFEEHLSEFASDNIYFASIGVFKKQVIYAQPVLNEYLQNFSLKVYTIFKDIKDIEISKFYRPYSWMPHMSIGKHLDNEQIVESFKLLVNQFMPMEATIERIGIAKTNPHKDIKVYNISRK